VDTVSWPVQPQDLQDIRHLSLVPLPHLHYLFPKDNYLYYYATSLPNRFSMKISYVLLVTFSQAILYGYNHIYLQNGTRSGRLTPQHGVSSGCR